MAHPIIHKTPKAKLAAAHEKCQCHYAKELILKRRRDLHSPKRDMKESQMILKAISKGLHGSTSDEDSESESEPDEENSSDDVDLSDLTQYLFALKIIKDEMLALTDDPCAFVQGVFQEYIKTLNSSAKGDVTILETPMATVQGLLNHIIPIQDQILNFCGISPEWRAADSVSHFLRTILAYLEDILCILTFDGLTELALAHSMGEFMYQKGIKI
ncbi:uncharacterized protein F5891DRAFT_1195237 [Suillus fuscotomentosus]|uniref:Uncharacterized protein n=1 Tax=Suillus fuscotomentosus TaxID=1912939 RepID=A0AAD4DV23_9AGAM|nr:uncharacterized protein F5891DRAFT_1195237 [Suillus fuscotomentosus]KAG1894400.1 hypothetical protein F5891DRAFT_1195237 [Suillus fuscotomentosus]